MKSIPFPEYVRCLTILPLIACNYPVHINLCIIYCTYKDPTSKREDLILDLELGNDKGAISRPEVLDNLIKKYIMYGFTLSILESEKQMKNGAYAPLNIKERPTIDE